MYGERVRRTGSGYKSFSHNEGFSWPQSPTDKRIARAQVQTQKNSFHAAKA
uniref:Uncharacterized protein n=1 Tax=Tetraselmis sp. GSL018 TaxID=582737 RepID=A0A061RW16_9CHLO